jgi:dolichol-phosphate mannosyltransferase
VSQPGTTRVDHAGRPEPLLSVVVPTYNERERLAEFVDTVFRALAAHDVEGELIIVDDHSPDGTGELAESLTSRYNARVVHRSGKLGLGSAVVAGFAIARGRFLGVMDADLSHPPDVLPLLLAAQQHAGLDFVVGSRYVAGGGTRNWPASRAFMSWSACTVARVLTPVRDTASGFFVIRREVLRDVEVKAAGFKICLELLVRGSYLSVAEVPYVFVDRAAGQSKMNHREALGFVVQLWNLYRWQRRHHRGSRPSYRRFTPEETAAFRPGPRD